MFRLLACLVLAAVPAFAAEQFYRISSADLKLLDGSKWPVTGSGSALAPGQFRVEMDPGAEAYTLGSWELNQDYTGGENILIRSTTDKRPSGTLYLRPQPQWMRSSAPANVPKEPAVTIVRFEVAVDPLPATAPASQQSRPDAQPSGPVAQLDPRSQFYYAKASYYTQMQNLGNTGAAWFRYQALLAEKELSPSQTRRLDMPMFNRGMLEHPEYDLFTGGRAVSENLQLDRPIRPGATDQNANDQSASAVNVADIPGISVAEMDFAKLLGNAQPQLDAAAELIPSDQYAVFFPSITSMFQMVDQLKTSALPVVENIIPPSTDQSFLRRYQVQLGLESSELARLLGPQLVTSVAITGSDPFFPTGTDVAILFRSPSPQLLAPVLLARIAASAGTQVKPQTASTGSTSYTAFTTPDRSISSYLATVNDTVIVSNSLAQLRAIVQASANKTGSLTSAPEYRFFRSRNQLGDPSESLFLVIPDAAIRKWCSARWRIADARRITARSKLLQGRAAELASGKLQADSPRDPVSGDLNFLTPISEFPLDKVSRAESQAYTQWRDRYQQYWRGAFDPIALKMSLNASGISADLTVMPLIASTEYRDMIAVTSGVSIDASSGDPHDAIFHFVMSLNRESAPVRQFASLGSQMGLQIDPLGWLGKSLAIYIDDDPILAEMAASEAPQVFAEKHLGQLPIAVRVESTSPFKLAAFLTALRTKIDQTAPRLTAWQTLESSGLPYVKITATPGQGMPDPTEIVICYAALPDSLLISPSEALIKRALARVAANGPATQRAVAAKPAAAPTARPWLGTNVAVQARSRAADLFQLASRFDNDPLVESSWNNLSILNEYHRLFPDQDPIALYERAWGTHLVCPAAGKYVWNEQLRTMESTVTGCPEDPKKLPKRDLVMNRFSFGNLGLSFENGGLRARMMLETPSVPMRTDK